MKKTCLKVLVGVTALIISTVGFSAGSVKVGQMAPNFEAKTDSGKHVSLKEYRGKVVVLEWTNPECPFVKRHYDHDKNMQNLQKEYVEKGVEWIRIISSAEGKQGYLKPEESVAYNARMDVAASETVLDPTGMIGHLYGAKTTPELYIINKKGVLVYQGAIDSKRSTNWSDNKSATNYVANALNDLLKGKSVTVPQTKSYGCAIKY